MTTHTLFRHPRAFAFLAGFAVLAGALAALAVPSTAAASPCGDKVLADWFDNGRIDRVYPLHCYDEAIDSIPADLRDYANAEEVISRALQAAVGGSLDDGGPDPTPRSQGGSGNPSGGPDNPRAPDRTPSGATPDEPSPEAAPAVDTSAPTSVPIPLLVLGGMSLALLGAGGLGYLSRRRHAADGDGFGDEDIGV